MSENFSARLLTRAAAVGAQVPQVHLPKLSVYADLLLRWNQRINLTALPLAGWPDASLDRLFLEPILAAPALQGRTGNWVDLGSGGGSPALPLAVLAPGLLLTLTESRGKKAAFLREAIRSIPVPGATVAGRFEELLSRAPASCAAITCRAVAPQEIESVANHLLAPGGSLLFFGASPLEGCGALALSRTVPLLSGDTLSILSR